MKLKYGHVMNNCVKSKHKRQNWVALLTPRLIIPISAFKLLRVGYTEIPFGIYITLEGHTFYVERSEMKFSKRWKKAKLRCDNSVFQLGNISDGDC